jgi:TolA-binding protein
MRRRVSLLLSFAFIMSTSAAALAQTADDKELGSYTLTLDTLNKVMVATRAMAKEMMSDPKYQQLMKIESQIDDLEKQMKPLQEKDELTDAESAKLDSLQEQLDKLEERKDLAQDAASSGGPNLNDAKTLTEMERGIAGFAPMARALKSAGLTPREYAKFTLAMLQAGMAYGLSQGKVDYAKLPPSVNPANIKFIAAHKAELEAMQREFENLGKPKR